jgi:hypothetical protein
VLTALFRRRRRALLGGALVLAALIGVAAFAFGGSADVVVYNGRSQYGDETVFEQWEDANGKSLELRGGTAPELFERLRSEGDGTGCSSRSPRRPWRSRSRRSSAIPTTTGGGCRSASARRCARPPCRRMR